MRILLDTHVLLWMLGEPYRLDKEIREILESDAEEVLFSAANIWEIAIKSQLGRADFAFAPGEIARAARDSGFAALLVGSEAAVHVAELPPLHCDLFDRLLVAQAITEPAIFYTADQGLPAYSELIHRLRSA
ncbi:MAG: type II toxin-antitoxin system VapC family toxin [Stellaceae bacterium]